MSVTTNISIRWLTQLGLLFLFGLRLLGAENIGSSAIKSTAIREAEANSATLQNYAKLPLAFERYSPAEFVARGQGYVIDLRGTRATIGRNASSTVGMEFIHGRQVPAIPGKELPGKVNYILGNNPQRWRLALPTYERIIYSDVYPDIDVVYYGNQKQLEFDFVLKPGADPRSIRMRFSGTGKPRVDPAGTLMLGDLRLKAPKVTQGDKTISAHYRIHRNGEVAFEVSAYDHRQPLIIDPTLVYSTRLGGGNGFNSGKAIAIDGSGNAYVAGQTWASDFPVMNAAFPGYQASSDGFISKINSTGTALVYSTYIGGKDYDYLTGIAVDSTGAAWAVGQTYGSDFPTLGAYQSASGGSQDAVVMKLSASGSLLFSSYLGGSGVDGANAVAVDSSGNAYVTGTASAGFPATAGAFQTANQGSYDAFVAKFSAGGSLVYSTFVGGATGYDYGTGIAVDSTGNAYITGATTSTSFVNAPGGGAQPAKSLGQDAFVAKLNAAGSSLLYFTFLGGAGFDQSNAITVQPTTGVAYVAGYTTSTDLLASAGAVQSSNAGGPDGFVAKLNSAGSAFLYFTYLGGIRNDFVQGLAVDPSGNAYLTGYTDSTNFPVTAPIQSAMQGNSTSLFRLWRSVKYEDVYLYDYTPILEATSTQATFLVQ